MHMLKAIPDEKMREKYYSRQARIDRAKEEQEAMRKRVLDN